MLLDANGVVLFANKEAQERLAPKNDSLEGASLASVLTPEHPLLALVQSTVAGTEAHDVPLTLPAGGTYLVSFFRLGRERVPAGLLIVLRDLAPVIELETALDSSNRLARLGTLISGLAHQLRSPLNGMNMRLELLRHEAGDKGAKHIDKLRHEVTRLDQAVEALLRFMRPEQLKLSGSTSTRCSRSWARASTASGSKSNTNSTPRCRRFVGPRIDLRSALESDNQRRTSDDGRRRLNLTSSLQGSSVEVRDSGQRSRHRQGELDRIFDLYYTTKSGGSGLGLPFAMRAIELNGGKIAIDSELGKGTVCKVTIPIAEIRCQISCFQRCISESTGRQFRQLSAVFVIADVSLRRMRRRNVEHGGIY